MNRNKKGSITAEDVAFFLRFPLESVFFHQAKGRTAAARSARLSMTPNTQQAFPIDSPLEPIPGMDYGIMPHL